MVPLGRLSVIFLRVLNLTFGGGEPMMAALRRELVDRRGWLSPEQYALCYGLARITPGTNVLAFSAAAAWFQRGWTGALICAGAATLPSAAFVVWLTHSYEVLKDNPLAGGAIAGLLAAAIGMMAAAAWLLIRPHFDRENWWRAAAIAGTSVVLLRAFGAAPVQVLALAAAAGYLWPPGEPK